MKKNILLSTGFILALSLIACSPKSRMAGAKVSTDVKTQATSNVLESREITKNYSENFFELSQSQMPSDVELIKLDGKDLKSKTDMFKILSDEKNTHVQKDIVTVSCAAGAGSAIKSNDRGIYLLNGSNVLMQRDLGEPLKENLKTQGPVQPNVLFTCNTNEEAEAASDVEEIILTANKFTKEYIIVSPPNLHVSIAYADFECVDGLKEAYEIAGKSRASIVLLKGSSVVTSVVTKQSDDNDSGLKKTAVVISCE